MVILVISDENQHQMKKKKGQESLTVDQCPKVILRTEKLTFDFCLFFPFFLWRGWAGVGYVRVREVVCGVSIVLHG